MSAPAETASATARPWRRASAWLLFLGPFFFATYGFTTWLTAQRTGVGSVVFAWEHAIPFVPWTIVPYWVIDAMYAVSLFVCADRSELDTHAKRLLTAQVVAIASFLLFPLRFSFERAETGGALGGLFALLGTFDRPFNQAPSLHIALLVILWALFARKLTGVARVICDASLVLVGVSVLTTWQHHFVDVPTGALVGFFCLWLWPQGQPSPFVDARWTSDRRRLVVAARYAIGALLMAASAAVAGGAAWWLLWVSIALLLVAVDYAWVGVNGFQKRDGRLSPAARVLLAPYLLGARINAWAWTRGQSPFDHIADDVWLGRMPTCGEVDRGMFTAIVDMTCELPLDSCGRAYVNLPVLDLTLPDRATLRAAADAVERLRSTGRVLVCCALGVTRSATAVAGWLVATGRARDAESALARLRETRPQIVLGDAHRARIAAMADSAAALV
jgi:protein-tyrosine phosphatase